MHESLHWFVPIYRNFPPTWSLQCMWSWTGFITAETASLWGVRGHGYIASTQRRLPFSRAFTLFKSSVACLSFVGRPVFEKHLSQLFYNIPKNELLSLWRNRIDSLKSNHLSRLLRHACYVVIPCFRSIYQTKSAAGFLVQISFPGSL